MGDGKDITYTSIYHIMVRNSTGGCKSKGFARKLQDSMSVSEPLRLPADECEVVALVKRMLGNGRMIVATTHASYPELQCMIRSKFRGRSKRNHMVVVGSVVLIGLHHWEGPNYKHSDLLHIYPSSSLSQLVHIKLIPPSFVNVSMFDDGGGKGGDDSFTFENTDHEDIGLPPPQRVPDMKKLTGGGGSDDEEEGGGELPDFDDI